MLQTLQYFFIMASSLRQSCRRVSADSSEIVFDEAHFIVNLQSFLQPQPFSYTPSPKVSHLSPIPPGRTTSKTPLLLIHQVSKNFKFMKNCDSQKMYFEIKILTLDIFTHMLPPPSPLPCITPAVSRDRHLEYQVSLCDLQFSQM